MSLHWYTPYTHTAVLTLLETLTINEKEQIFRLKPAFNKRSTYRRKQQHQHGIKDVTLLTSFSTRESNNSQQLALSDLSGRSSGIHGLTLSDSPPYAISVHAMVALLRVIY